MLPGDAAMRSATSACTMTVAERERGHLLEEAQNDGGGDRVRQVGDERGRRAERLGDQPRRDHGDRVGTHDCEARALGGGLGERGKQLASRSTATTAPACCAQRDGERADAGTDLEHGLVAGERGEFEDAADDVVVDEEVLAERLLGGQAVALEHRRSSPREWRAASAPR